MVLTLGVLGSGKTLVLSLAVMLLHELINTASANVEHIKDSPRKNWKVMVTGNSDAQVPVTQFDCVPEKVVLSVVIFGR